MNAMDPRHHWICAGLALVITVAMGGCGDLDLGEIPFQCNKGNPKCPNGYTCNAKDNVCHREGECPAGVSGCPRAPDGGTTKPPEGGAGTVKGKFCNGLQNKDGSKFSSSLVIGAIALTAKSGLCSPCTALPVGKHKLSLLMEGDWQPPPTGSVTLDKGKEYLFWSDLDTSNQIKLEGGSLKPEYKCATTNPFKTP